MSGGQEPLDERSFEERAAELEERLRIAQALSQPMNRPNPEREGEKADFRRVLVTESDTPTIAEYLARDAALMRGQDKLNRSLEPIREAHARAFDKLEEKEAEIDASIVLNTQTLTSLRDRVREIRENGFVFDEASVKTYNSPELQDRPIACPVCGVMSVPKPLRRKK